MRYYHFNVEYLNWWWRYRVGYRDPKAGQITIYGHHYKCANFHHFPMFPSWGCHRAPWAKNNNNNKYSCKQQLPGPSPGRAGRAAQSGKSKTAETERT